MEELNWLLGYGWIRCNESKRVGIRLVDPVTGTEMSIKDALWIQRRRIELYGERTWNVK